MREITPYHELHDTDLEPAPYPDSDDEEPEVYVEYSRALLEERKEAFEPYRVEWTQNLLFLAGLQWYKYSPRSGHFRLEPLPPWKERPVWNMLKPFAKSFMAKLLKNKPVASCIPASSDPNDIYAAQLGDDVLRAKWIELKLADRLSQAVAWLTATGNSYLMPYWNTMTGKLLPLTALSVVEQWDVETDDMGNELGPTFMGSDAMECPCDENGDFLMDEDGNHDMEAQPSYYDMGEVGVKCLSPFQVFPNTAATNIDDMDSFIIAEAMSIRQIRRRWPNAENVKPEDTSDIDNYDNLLHMGQFAGADTHYTGPQFDQSDTGDRKRRALVLHYYEKPCPDFPAGRYWVTCGKELLDPPEGLPDELWPPVIHMKDIEVPGSFLGEATMTAAVGIQKEINEHAARQKEHFKLMVQGKWSVAKGSGIKRGAITTRPGEVIQHNPGQQYEPKQILIRPLPAAVYQEREKLLQVFHQITSLHEVSQGQAPEGITAGRAFLILQEADDTDLGPLTERMEGAVAMLSWHLIQLIQANYDDERLLRITGKHKVYQIRPFMGADLEAVVDVEPVTGSAFPWNKTARQSYVLDMMQVNPALFIDPETGIFDQQRFRDALPVGGEEAIGNAADADVSAALREQDRFLGWDGSEETEGMLPVPQIWQNHQIHLRQHAKVLNSATFEDWPPHAQQAFVRHYFATSQAQMLQMAQMREIMQPAEQSSATGSPSMNGGDGSSSTGPARGAPPSAEPRLYPSETRGSNPSG